MFGTGNPLVTETYIIKSLKVTSASTPTVTVLNDSITVGAGDGSSGGGGSFSTEKKGKEGAFGTFDGTKGRKDYRQGGLASLL